jgi:carbohydrate kinase (thermoresistant glucokinase family)
MAKIVVVMGVAGSGKTTVGTMLAEAMHCTFLEGDSLHSAANVEKMSRGIPLTDADRAPWLAAIHARLLDSFRWRESGRRLLGAQAIVSDGPRRRDPDRLGVSQRLEIKVVLEWAA